METIIAMGQIAKDHPDRTKIDEFPEFQRNRTLIKLTRMPFCKAEGCEHRLIQHTIPREHIEARR
jgi:hypothetical protein